MLNLIRMNLYRMVKTRSLWAAMLSMALFCVFSCYMVTIDLDALLKTEDIGTAETGAETGGLAGVYKEEAPEDVESSFGITIQVPEKENGETPTFLEFYNSDLASGIILIFLTLGSVIYFSRELKSGFLKNIAGQTKHKPDIFLSKIFVNILYILCSLIIYGVVQFVSLWIMLKGMGTLRFGTEYLKETGLLLLTFFILYLAFLGGISLITTISKSTAAGITIGILASFGIFGVFASYAEKILHVSIVKYLVVTNIQQMLIGTPQKDVLFAVAIGVLFSVCYYLLGAVYFTKKDVV